MILTIRSNAATTSDVLVRDRGFSVPYGGGSVLISDFDELRQLGGSKDLITFCTDDAFGPDDSTLFLNDGTGDIPQDYVIIFLATVGISTAVPEACAVPKAISTGKIDGGWLPRKEWGPSASDPVGSPSDGDLYYNTTLDMEMLYDSGRGKWLSTKSSTFQFGKAGNTAAGSYFRGPGDLSLSNTIGYPAFHNGTVVALGYTRSDTASATIEITSNGTAISSIASSAVLGYAVDKNDNFSAGVVLAARNQSGGNTMANVQGWVKMKWRA